MKPQGQGLASAPMLAPSQPAMMVRQPVGLTPGMSSMAPQMGMAPAGPPAGMYGAPPGGMYPPQQQQMGGMYGPGAGMPMQGMPTQGFPPQQGGYGGFPPPGSYPRGM